MEQGVFLRPPVRDLLAEGFVEARLHTDDPDRGEALRRLQQEMTNSVALPIYLLVDPKTKKIGPRLDGARSAADFAEFLKRGV
jgi:hypothetical protein